MRVNEAENSIVQAELDHHSAFPAVSNHILHDIVLLYISHEKCIIFLHEDGKEHFAFANHLDHVKFMLQIALDVTYFFLLFATALLTTIGNDIIVAVVWEEFVDEDVLRLLLSGMVPGDSHDVKRHLAIDQLPLPRCHILAI